MGKAWRALCAWCGLETTTQRTVWGKLVFLHPWCEHRYAERTKPTVNPLNPTT